MAQDTTTGGTGSGTGDSPLTTHLSGWNVGENAGTPGAAVCKIRDSLVLPTAPTLADGGAGSNTTAGVHYAVVTWVTLYGESIRGVVSASINITTLHIITVTVPTFAQVIALGTGVGLDGNVHTPPWLIGRNVYLTKAGAPAAATDPTNSQYFLPAAAPATTIAAGSNNLRLPQATINLASSTGFNSVAGNLALVTTSEGPQIVTYTAAAANQLTGCTGGKGLMSTGGVVSAAAGIQNNTATSVNFDIADGSFTATNPPTIDTAGKLLVPKISLAASQSTGDPYGANVTRLSGGGGAYFEVTSGTVAWTMRGI